MNKLLLILCSIFLLIGCNEETVHDHTFICSKDQHETVHTGVFKTSHLYDMDWTFYDDNGKLVGQYVQLNGEVCSVVDVEATH